MKSLESMLSEAKKDLGDATAEIAGSGFVAPIMAYISTSNFIENNYLIGSAFAAATAFLAYVVGSRYMEVRECREEIADLKKEISETKPALTTVCKSQSFCEPCQIFAEI